METDSSSDIDYIEREMLDMLESSSEADGEEVWPAEDSAYTDIANTPGEEANDSSEVAEGAAEALVELMGPPQLRRQNALSGPDLMSALQLHDDINQERGTEPESDELVIDLAEENNHDSSPEPLAESQFSRVHTVPSRGAQDRFRLDARYFFCTWPQCTEPKEAVLARIKAIPNFECAVVCREDHKDDAGVHLHAFFALTKRRCCRGFAFLDSLANGKHGDYRAARNKLHVVRYVIKDGDIVFDGFDPRQYVANMEKRSSGPKKETKAQLIARMIEEEDADLEAVNSFDPGWVLANKRKAEEYISWRQYKKARLALTPLPALDPDSYNDPWNKLIAAWIKDNIGVQRQFKQKQLYIWSNGPDVGKTHLVEMLSKHCNTYHLPKNAFVDGYESGTFDLVVCDEFKSHHTIQFLNEFLQGSKMHLNQKGGGTYKTDNPPMIFLSNHSLDECFRNKCHTGAYYALAGRFLIVEVPLGSKIDVFKQLP
jgi:hypothetical protein